MTENRSLLVFAAIVAIAGLSVTLYRQFVRWQRRRRWLRAQRAEQNAPALLSELGYVVVGTQVESRYSLMVDGQPHLVRLRADYLVERNGLTYVAEVKSGKFAPRLENSATRRQLLEYLVAFQVQGVLLVDNESRRVKSVVFPVAAQHPSRLNYARIGYYCWALLLFLLFVAWVVRR